MSSSRLTTSTATAMRRRSALVAATSSPATAVSPARPYRMPSSPARCSEPGHARREVVEVGDRRGAQGVVVEDDEEPGCITGLGHQRPCTASSGRALGLSTPATPGCCAELTAEIAELLAVAAHAGALQQHLRGRDHAGREAGGRRPRGLGRLTVWRECRDEGHLEPKAVRVDGQRPEPDDAGPAEDERHHPNGDQTSGGARHRAAAVRRGLAGQNSPRPKMASRAGSRVTDTATAVSTDSESTGPKARRKPDFATSMAAQPAATAMPATSTIRPVWAAEARAAPSRSKPSSRPERMLER